jgi:hypothetical protein
MIKINSKNSNGLAVPHNQPVKALTKHASDFKALYARLVKIGGLL